MLSPLLWTQIDASKEAIEKELLVVEAIIQEKKLALTVSKQPRMMSISPESLPPRWSPLCDRADQTAKCPDFRGFENLGSLKLETQHENLSLPRPSSAESIDRYRYDNHQTFDHKLPEVGHIEQRQTVVQHRNN
jgi:hypothetical protein